MKSFVAICIVVALAAVAQGAGLTAEQTQKLKDNYKRCFESSHVNKDLVTKARNGEFTDNAELDNFFTCMFKASDFIDDEGHLKLDVIRSKVPSDISKEDVEKVLSACSKVQESPKEKVAKEAYKCYLTKTPVKIQLISDAA